jgi:hypothetical protein
MKTHLTLFAMLAIGCTGDSGKDSGATDSGGECAAEDFYTGPVTIETASVDCNGNTVRFSAETNGWTDGGWVFSQETGNTEAQWSDQHDLVSDEYDACGAWDRLEREIQDGSTLNDPLDDWQENVSSVFTCDAHYNDSNVMSYAFAVVDIDGAFADCVAYGDDPDGLVNNNYDRVNDPSGFNPGDCGRGVLAR